MVPEAFGTSIHKSMSREGGGGEGEWRRKIFPVLNTKRLAQQRYTEFFHEKKLFRHGRV
jgi:hypothetical protein